MAHEGVVSAPGPIGDGGVGGSLPGVRHAFPPDIGPGGPSRVRWEPETKPGGGRRWRWT